MLDFGKVPVRLVEAGFKGENLPIDSLELVFGFYNLPLTRWSSWVSHGWVGFS